MLVVVGLALAVMIATALAYGLTSKELAIAALLVIAVCLAITHFVEPGLDRWDRGATGEEHVGAVLAGLEADGWRAIHDVSFGRGNIDHIVVGPGGLFTIETKSHGGRIAVDRIDARMLRQAYAESKSLERIVGQRVVPLLVFSRAYIDRPKKRSGVVVLPARMLPGHLGRRHRVLDPAQVDSIHARLLHACG